MRDSVRRSSLPPGSIREALMASAWKWMPPFAWFFVLTARATAQSPPETPPHPAPLHRAVLGGGSEGRVPVRLAAAKVSGRWLGQDGHDYCGAVAQAV